MPRNQSNGEIILASGPILIVDRLNALIEGTKKIYFHGDIKTEIKVKTELKDFILKKTFDNEENYERDIALINEIKPEEFNILKLHNLGFKKDSTSLVDSIQKNWASNFEALTISSLSGFSTYLLMSKIDDPLLKDTVLEGDGMWSKEFASDTSAQTARIMNAVLPLLTTVLNNYVEDNRYGLEKKTYDRLKTTIALGDIKAMIGTLIETYSFNRGLLPEEDIYRPLAIFESTENFQTVFLNKFSGWFLPEQVLRTFKNVVRIIHHKTGAISEEKVNTIESIINPISALFVAGAFGNITVGLNSGTIPKNILPNENPIKNTIGIQSASAGASWFSIKAAFNGAKSLVNKAISLCIQKEVQYATLEEVTVDSTQSIGNIRGFGRHATLSDSSTSSKTSRVTFKEIFGGCDEVDSISEKEDGTEVSFIIGEQEEERIRQNTKKFETVTKDIKEERRTKALETEEYFAQSI